MTHRTCSFDGCERSIRTRQWCDPHYKQWLRGEDLRPIGGRRPKRPAPERFWEKVNKTESCWIWTARKLPMGYGEFWADSRKNYAHRWSYAFHNGPIPDGMEIDHICHVPSCVNPAHLRIANRSENSAYLTGAKSSNLSTGIRNVYPAKRKGRPGWRVSVKRQAGGVYDTIEEAEEAARVLRARLFEFPDF